MSENSKTALVTGGAKRVGRSICLGLAASGYSVVIHHNRSENDAQTLVDEIQSMGGKASAVSGDLTSSHNIAALFQNAVSEFGPIDLLINNASVFEEDSYHAFDEDVWDRHFNLHVKAPSLLAAEFVKQNLSDGLIINMIDERVWKLTPNFTSYTLSKTALWNATRTMAQAFAPNVRVNAIGPGPTLPSDRQTEADFDAQVKTLLLQRAPELAEFTETILFLVKARSVTGQMIALDGGQHLGWQTPDQLVPE